MNPNASLQWFPGAEFVPGHGWLTPSQAITARAGGTLLPLAQLPPGFVPMPSNINLSEWRFLMTADNFPVQFEGHTILVRPATGVPPIGNFGGPGFGASGVNRTLFWIPGTNNAPFPLTSNTFPPPNGFILATTPVPNGVHPDVLFAHIAGHLNQFPPHHAISPHHATAIFNIPRPIAGGQGSVAGGSSQLLPPTGIVPLGPPAPGTPAAAAGGSISAPARLGAGGSIYLMGTGAGLPTFVQVGPHIVVRTVSGTGEPTLTGPNGQHTMRIINLQGVETVIPIPAITTTLNLNNPNAPGGFNINMVSRAMWILYHANELHPEYRPIATNYARSILHHALGWGYLSPSQIPNNLVSTYGINTSIYNTFYALPTSVPVGSIVTAPPWVGVPSIASGSPLASVPEFAIRSGTQYLRCRALPDHRILVISLDSQVPANMLVYDLVAGTVRLPNGQTVSLQAYNQPQTAIPVNPQVNVPPITAPTNIPTAPTPNVLTWRQWITRSAVYIGRIVNILGIASLLPNAYTRITQEGPQVLNSVITFLGSNPGTNIVFGQHIPNTSANFNFGRYTVQSVLDEIGSANVHKVRAMMYFLAGQPIRSNQLNSPLEIYQA
jgi:hypothetical protein